MDNESLVRRLEREKLARKQAELLLEEKSRELYKANLKLSSHTADLERTVSTRTEHLQRALQEIQSASRIKKQFVSNISHELRTPLNGVLGTLQLLSERPIDVAQKKLITHALLSAERLKVLISDMLDMSRLESGDIELDEYEFNLGSLIRELVGSFVEQAEQKGIDIQLSGMVLSDLQVISDPVRLRQVLFNLLSNAVKFSDRGCVTIHVGFKNVKAGQLMLYASVADEGVGIPEHQISTIFENFTQLDDASNRRYEGAGLGLATSSQLLQMMDSRIRVFSEPDRGSTFWFSIPLKHDIALAESCDGCQVMLLAPYDGDRTVTVKEMSQAGFDVTVVNDTQAMLNKLEEGNCEYELVMIDERIVAQDCDLLKTTYPPYWRQRTALLCLSKHKALPVALEHQFVTLLESPVEMSELSAAISVLNEAGEVWQESADKVSLSQHILQDLAVAEESPSEQSQHLVQAKESPVAESCWRGKVLVVEDNRVNAMITIEMLNSLGITSHWVMDGKQAIEALQNERFELVLMDCHMPVMDGYEATRRIRAGEAGDALKLIPIVALTADNPAKGLHSFMLCDMNGWIAKPLESQRMDMEMKRHLLRREYASEYSFEARLQTNPKLSVALLQHWQQTLNDMIAENLRGALSDDENSIALLAEIADAMSIDSVREQLHQNVTQRHAGNHKINLFDSAARELIQHIKSKLHSLEEVLH